MYVRLAAVAAVLVCSLPANAHMTEECWQVLFDLESARNERLIYHLTGEIPDTIGPPAELFAKMTVLRQSHLSAAEREKPVTPSESLARSIYVLQKEAARVCGTD